AGRLDPNFGIGGQITSEARARNYADALLLQPNGKLIAVATAEWHDHVHEHAMRAVEVLRYTRDGRPDRSFNGGHVVTPFGRAGYVAGAALQSDGKIDVLAYVHGTRLLVLRYTTLGRLDRRFGDDGTSEIDFGPGGLEPAGIVV